MNQQLQQELADLASKLGTTTEHLWNVLVRRAYIDGFTSLLSLLVCVVLAAITVVGFCYLQRKYPNVSPNASLWPPPEYVRWLLLAIALLFRFVTAGLYWVITDFSNPEYYAFHQLPFTK